MLWTVHLEGGPKKVNHAAACIGDRIFSFGGYCSSEDFENTVLPIPVYILNTNNLRWCLVNNENKECPYQRYGHTVVPYEDKIYMWGGRDNRIAFKNLCYFDISNHEWVVPETSGKTPHPVDGHSACVINDVMYVFGGFENFSVEYSSEVHTFHLKTLKWSFLRTTGTPPSPRDFHSATAVGTRMYVFGGRSSVGIDDAVYCPRMYYLETTTNEWFSPETTGDIPVGRRSHSAWLHNEEIYIFGGYNGKSDKHFNDLYKFSPATCKWTLLKIAGNPPCKRRRQCCVLVKNQMYLFGGTGPNSNPSTVDLIDKSDLHILDYAPSLKTLCILSIIKYKLSLDGLPEDILFLEICKNVYVSHGISGFFCEFSDASTHYKINIFSPFNFELTRLHNLNWFFFGPLNFILMRFYCIMYLKSERSSIQIVGI